MILKVLLTTQIILMIFMKMLTNTIQIRNAKYWSFLMIWLLMCLEIKKLIQIVTKLYVRDRTLNISLVFIAKSDFTVSKNYRLNLHIILLWKFQTNENFNKSNLIIHQIMNFKTLWIFIKNVLQNHTIFYLLILLLLQIIFYVLERIF